MFLTIIIPAYNEESRLGSTLEKVYDYLALQAYECEVIVVNDGSADKTKEVAMQSTLYSQGKLKILDNGRNRGKGFSVKNGILVSSGDYVLFSDADLSTPIEECEKLFSVVRSGFDIAIGSRSISGADVRVHQPFYRELMGRVFNFLVQTFAFRGFVDTQCGFKLFRASVAKDLAAVLTIHGFGFDVEMLYMALKRSYKVKEVPVIWINSPTSKVNPLIDASKMIFEVMSIKRIHA
jgi:dolichyl-phosphate beta-glucosyltransferase